MPGNANDYAVSLEEFSREIDERGWVRIPGVLKPDAVEGLGKALESVYKKQRVIQEKNGVAEGLTGTVHCLLGWEKAFDDFMAHLPLQTYLQEFFAKPYILNNYGGVINFPANNIYANRPHRDVRDFTAPARLMMNMLVMLDDFTLENGATKVLAGSHKRRDEKEAEYFEERAERVTGKAGDIVLWDSNLLHSAGFNKTDVVRRALTICFSRPYIKPTIDFLSALDKEFIESQNEFVKTMIGYYARPAADVSAFFQPREKWSYRMQ